MSARDTGSGTPRGRAALLRPEAFDDYRGRSATELDGTGSHHHRLHLVDQQPVALIPVRAHVQLPRYAPELLALGGAVIAIEEPDIAPPVDPGLDRLIVIGDGDQLVGEQI